MNNKVFKSALSVAVAFAVIFVSLFAAAPAININASAATVTDTWDGTLATSFERGSGTEGDPYIIATAEQLAYAVLSASTVSSGKYFKVVDNATFNLSGMADITLDSTVGDVMAATTDKNWRPTVDGTKTFAGYFDGNGVVIYNMYSGGHGFTGLFPRPDNNNSANTSWVKNITLLNSRSIGYHSAGGIAGSFEAPNTSKTLTIENCKVLNCWISDNHNTASAQKISGIIAGNITHNATTIKNCFVSGNVTSATEISGGLVGQTSGYTPSVSIQNCIVLGSLPYPTVTGSSSINKFLDVPSTYEGVYTDQAVDAKYAANQVKTVAENDMKGAAAKNNMPDFDWNTWIAFEGELPDYRANHTLTLINNGAQGHSVSCSDCSKSMLESHNIVEDATGTVGNCECGYTAPITERRTDVWDGSFDSNFPAGDGTKNNPYIIKTAEQMAYVALKTTLADSDGKYYTVAPNMVFNMNGLVGITMDSTVEEVKAATVGKNWSGNSDNATAAFFGHFDGNGVIIYNIYSKGAYAGLFPQPTSKNTNNSISIKNVTVLASFMQGYHQSGGIAGIANAQNGEGSFTIENCAVKNSYIGDNNNSNPATGKIAGAIVGNVAHNNTVMKNCFAIGNDVGGSKISSGLIGNCSAYCQSIKITDSVSIGTVAYPVSTSAAEIDAKMLDPNNYSGVYTDQAVSGFGKNQIRSLTVDMMSGVNAPQNMTLDFGKYWFANTGVLDLLVCHNVEGDVNPDDGYAGHTAVCKACGIAGVNILNHTYNSDYTCTLCGFTCDHQNDDYITKTEFTDNDCITPKNTKIQCECGYASQTNHSEASGHKLEKTEAKEPTCAQAGNVEYWTCENCECIFLTDDVMAPYEDAVTQAQVTLNATGLHQEIKDSEGAIVYFMDEESHWTTCEECNAKLKRVEHTIKYTDDDAFSHDGVCEICLYEAAEDEVHTFAVDGQKCHDCKWICNHDGTVEKVEVSEPSCSEAGVSTAHYRCTVCDMRFADEAATAQLDKETVIIEKLGHDYIDFDANGTPVHEFNETHHWYNCNVCGKGDYAEHIMAEDTENYEGTYKWCEDETGYGCKYSMFDYLVKNEDESVVVTAPTNAFTKDVITDIFRFGSTDEIYAEYGKIFAAANQQKFVAYEITPSQTLADGSKATITIDIPSLYGKDAAIYFVDLENGKLEKLETRIQDIPDEKNPEDLEKMTYKAHATTDKFGYFAIASAAIDTSDDAVNGDNNTVSPPTADTTPWAMTIIVILASVTLLFVRKAKI